MAKPPPQTRRRRPLPSEFLSRSNQAMPHRALMFATGVARSQMGEPLIGIASSFTDLIPGHVEMRSLERFIERGVSRAGGVPFVFGIPGICDGIAMGHVGMRYSLPSRELIADMVESIVRAHSLDGVLLLTNCDKITPGMLMAAVRLDRPAVVLTAGPMLTGRTACPGPNEGKRLDLVKDTFEAWIQYERGQMSARGDARPRDQRLPRRRLLPGALHGQHHGVPDRGDGHVARRLRHRAGGVREEEAPRLRVRPPAGRARPRGRHAAPRS